MLRVADLGKMTYKGLYLTHSAPAPTPLFAAIIADPAWMTTTQYNQGPLSKAYLNDDHLRGASAKFRPAIKA